MNKKPLTHDADQMNSSRIKDFAGSIGVDCVGVTKPEGLGIPDKFNWVKSVIVLGVYSLDEHVDAILRQEYTGKKRWSKWIYEIVDNRAMKMCIFLKDNCFKAVYSRNIDLVKASVEAGIGSVGKNRMIITPEAGPRVRLVAVMTYASLDIDEPFKGELCNEKCRICIKSCPGNALTIKGFQRGKCIAEFSPTQEMVVKQKANEKNLSEYIRIQCLQCMISCPVGKDLKAKSFDVMD